ncbi:Alpha/Beta hydrolase protein [Aspergillus pseudodeflectus]|uniref:Alpha/Beta hydrolase protein n=1 Tax=Aspergillus pseudodeflectus TaxID=176178 RepID=A0ABR4JTX5_9EURO
MSTLSTSPYSSIPLISNATFHRHITLLTPHGPQTLTYALIGSNDAGPTRTLLFLPGMFASRYLGIPLHILAERAGVRILVVDRFGMGGSGDVPLSRRISTWCDVIPRLLEYLGIESVGLVAHSAGTIYTLNMLVDERCRRLIQGVVVFLAPWVDPTHSHVTSMQLAQYIPQPAFKLWHHIPRFFVTQATPVLASSGAAMRKISAPSSGLISSSQSQEEADRTFLEANYARVEREYGVPVKEQEELARLAVNYMFAENTVGANSEALQCLRKGEGREWGAVGDYAGCIKGFVEKERERGREESRQDERGIRVRVYHAATDAMVGRKGQEYFEGCWRGAGDGVDFDARRVEGTDHDTVSQAAEVWVEIFALFR